MWRLQAEVRMGCARQTQPSRTLWASQLEQLRVVKDVVEDGLDVKVRGCTRSDRHAGREQAPRSDPTVSGEVVMGREERRRDRCAA